jgi:hypothetical protein
MRLGADLLGVPVWHDCRNGFTEMLRHALDGDAIVAAHGPIYETDPAEALLLPFRMTARETGWDAVDERWLAPEHILEQSRILRDRAVASFPAAYDHMIADMSDWARAGLVLEIARRAGVNVTGRGVLRPVWRLKGTVTGRFGCDPVRGFEGAKAWTFNPLSLGPDDRWRVRPSDAVRHIAVLDFKAMDLCSMISIVPGLKFRYRHLMADPHSGTAVLLAGGRSFDEGWVPDGTIRDDIKRELFVHAYGGRSLLAYEFRQFIPELAFLTSLPEGEAGRRIQTQSAIAFRAALSRVLPTIVSQLHHYTPMFAVHDELVLDCSEVGLDRIREEIARPMEEGASERIGVAYRVGITTGYTYAEAKGG